MKTAGRLTATLITLLSLYLLGYWLLIKQGWSVKLLWSPTASSFSLKVHDFISDAFAPIGELERIWTIDLFTQKHLTGHWRTENSEDFVTLKPSGECEFQLGAYAFKGKATFERGEVGFIMEFPHQEQKYLFNLVMNHMPGGARLPDLATALISTSHVLMHERQYHHEATLTKQLPNVPAPQPIPASPIPLNLQFYQSYLKKTSPAPPPPKASRSPSPTTAAHLIPNNSAPQRTHFSYKGNRSISNAKG